ncbi:MAG: hypothetical protein WDW38_003167 [Sanguina aurantia]
MQGARPAEQDGSNTVWISYEGAGSYSLPDVRQLLLATASPLGSVTALRIIHHKTMAFLSYSLRTSAEFAIEALQGQGLTGSSTPEVLEVRWARPSTAPREVKLRQARSAYYASAGPSKDMLEQVDFSLLTQAQQSARIEGMRSGGAHKRARGVRQYPDTDTAYLEAEAEAGATREPGVVAAAEDPQGGLGGVSLQEQVPEEAATAGGQHHASQAQIVADGSQQGRQSTDHRVAEAGVGGYSSEQQAYHAWWYSSAGQHVQQQQQRWQQWQQQEWVEGEPGPPGDDAYLPGCAEESCGVQAVGQPEEMAALPAETDVDQAPVSMQGLGSLLAGYGSSDEDE